MSRRPLAIGMVMDEPTRLALMCAGMSSGPSMVCCKKGWCSGTILLKKDSKSTSTSGSAASLIVRPAEVCLMNRWSSPFSGSVPMADTTSLLMM